MIKYIKDIDEVLKFACELSKCDSTASYPRMTSVNQIKEELLKAIQDDKYHIMAYYSENEIKGLCAYFCIDDEKYSQTTIFLIKDNYDSIADKMISEIKSKLHDFKLLVGVPTSNTTAINYFEKRNIKCIESSVVTHICKLKPSYAKQDDHIMTINKKNFCLYSAFHDKYAIPYDIYYTSKNVCNSINDFIILAYVKKDIVASIFAKIGDEIADIFGLFIDEKFKYNGIEQILINHLLSQLYLKHQSIKEILFFIDDIDHQELRIVLETGFKVKERYKCYKL